MSDEEVTCHGSSGNDLYAYLVDQGYSDFETFIPSSSENENKVDLGNVDLSKKGPSFNSTNCNDSDVPILIEANDHQKLLNILHSQLLFKEDVDIIESFMSNVCVYKSRSSLLLYISAAAGLLTSTFLLKNRTSIYFLCGATAFFSLYSAWKCYREFKVSCDVKVTLSHVSMLQKLCSNTHKLLRFLKETEILSTGKVSIHNVGAAMYMPLPALGVDELNRLPAWKTLPHLRRYLVDSLVEIVKILSFACDDLRYMSPFWLHESGNVTYKDISQCINKLINSDQCSSIKQIQSLNDTYLVIQSEYLRWIAVNLSPVWGNSVKQKESAQKEVLKLISQVQLKLNDISFKLMMHYNIHNTSSTINKSIHQKSLKNRPEKIKDIQVEVHNIFLLIFSILLRVRSLEDCIENISDISEIQNRSNTNLIKELSTLKDDLTHAVRCYDAIIYQTISGTKVNIPKQDSPTDEDSIRTTADLESKPLGILVGASDFSVNSADEVFLAVSGLKTEDQEGFIDDWCVDKKAHIPNTLLIELSNTLKSRKKDFCERERKALERQGLQDIADESDDAVVEESDKEVLPYENICLKKTNIKRNKYSKGLMNSNSSSSDSEQFEQKRTVFTEKLRSKCEKGQQVLDSENSSSEDEISNLDSALGKQCVDRPRPINNTSIANLIAMKSQLWGKTSEECYSDG